MFRSSTATHQPLGTVLQQAGLISARQINIALQEQKRSKRRIGEVLADLNCIKQESADFFADQWPRLQHQTLQLRLGQYLKRAALLDEAQIRVILHEQRQTQLRFGTLAILKGWVQRQTINFFLEHLDQIMHPALQRAIASDVAADAEELRRQLLENTRVNPFSLLLAYQRLLLEGTVKADGSPEQSELITLGLVATVQNGLQLARGLDPLLLRPQWVSQGLDRLRPYHEVQLRLLQLGQHSTHPDQVLAAIQTWTDNQPDLTQAVCRTIRARGVFITADTEVEQVDKLVHDHIIHGWESGTAAKHLLELRHRWLHSKTCSPSELLELYGRILEEYKVPSESTLGEQVLLNLGLITTNGRTLSIANPIYRQVFNHPWITQELINTQVSSPQSDSQEHQFLTPMLQGGEEDLANENSSFLSPEELEDSDILAAKAMGLFTPPTPSADDELSAAEVESFISGTEMQAAALATDPDLENSSQAIAKDKDLDEHKVPVAVTASPSPLTRSWQIKWGMVLGATGIGLAIAGMTQLRPQKPQVSPTETAPNSVNQRQILPKQGAVATRKQKIAPEEATPSKTQTPSSTPNSSVVVSASDPTIKIPVFRTGSTQKQVLDNLGPPTANQDGYYPGSRAFLYKGIIPNRIDLGYLINTDTETLLQTEIAFAQSVPLEILQKTLRQLTQSKLPVSVQEQLTKIYQRQTDHHSFAVENWKGEIHRNLEDQIYIGIWDADFH